MKTFEEILQRMAEIHAAKAHDYSPGEDTLGNFTECRRVGVAPHIGCFIRLQDKYTRACNLIQGVEAAVRDETIEDTLIDMANYAILTLLLIDDRPKAEPSEGIGCVG